MKDEGFISCFGHHLQILDDLPSILVNSVSLASREVESCLEVVPGISSSPEVEQGEPGEDAEG